MAGIDKEEAERFGVRWELAVRAWPKPAAGVTKPGGEQREPLEEYEDDPTLPWWEAPPQEPRPPSGRLLMVAVVLVVVLVLTAVIGAVALG